MKRAFAFAALLSTHCLHGADSGVPTTPCATVVGPRAALTCRGDRLEDLQQVGRIAGLRRLHLDRVELKSLRGLEQAQALEFLAITDVAIDDLGPLAELPLLSEVRLERTAVASLAPLAHAPRLHTLVVHDSPVKDLSPVAGLEQLALLDVMNTEVSDVAPIGQLPALVTLGLRGTPIKSLSALSTLPALEVIDIIDTQIADVSPLASVATLQVILLQPARLSSLAPLRRFKQLLAVGVPVSKPAVASKRYMFTVGAGGQPTMPEPTAADSSGDRDRGFRDLRSTLRAQVTIYRLDPDKYRLEVRRVAAK